MELPKPLVRASSHLAGRTKRPNPKLLSRGEDRSSLKYIINVFLSDSEYFIEKNFDLSTRVWISIFDAPKLFSRGQTLGTKNAKKYCHVGTLEAFHLWSLATSVKAQRSTSWLSTNHIARFLHLSNRPAKCEDPLIFGHKKFNGLKHKVFENIHKKYDLINIHNLNEFQPNFC